MSPTWHSDAPPPLPAPLGLPGWTRVVLRGVPVLLVLLTGLMLKALVRLVEAPLFRTTRPVSPWITVAVCRIVLRLLGLRMRIAGQPDPGAGLLVANHASWLDIFVLNAVRPLYFVAKSEVAGWPGIGLLARATGTVFVSRDPRAAREQAALLAERLAHGHRLMLFPEGTSSDGRRVLPFRSSMFAALRGLGPAGRCIQPITVAYRAPAGRDARFYGWWGDMELAPHLLQVLAASPQGSVTVIHHAACRAEEGADRKQLASALEQPVKAGLEDALATGQPSSSAVMSRNVDRGSG